MVLHKVEGKMSVEWNSEVKAIIDTWYNYMVSLDEFKEAVMIKGLNHAKANKGIAWIADSTYAKGSFSKEIQDYIGSDVFPSFAKNGIKYFITINSKASAITNLTVKSYAAKVGPAGIKLLEVNSIKDAVFWLKNN